MNKKLIISAVISALLLSGCAAENDVSKAAETTTATAVTTEQQIFIDPMPEIYEFDSYDAFTEKLKEVYPDKYTHPMPDVIYSWTADYIMFQYGGQTFRFIDEANQTTIFFDLDHNTAYSTISEFTDNNFLMGSGRKVIEETDRYAVIQYTIDDSYQIIGITGEFNLFYKLNVNSDDETKDPVELLKEYKEILEL